MIIYTDDNGFENAVKQTEITLVDFFASWCGPCRMLNTELIKLDNSIKELNIVKVDIDESLATTEEFKIEVVPTMFILNTKKKSNLATRHFIRTLPLPLPMNGYSTGNILACLKILPMPAIGRENTIST